MLKGYMFREWLVTPDIAKLLKVVIMPSTVIHRYLTPAICTNQMSLTIAIQSEVTLTCIVTVKSIMDVLALTSGVYEGLGSLVVMYS